MNNIFFSADFHFLHENIVGLSSRPFDSYGDMEDKIITNWNDTVGSGDMGYILGDFALTWNKKCPDKVNTLLKRLNGNKFLITGNHDREAVTKSKYWSKVTPYHEIKVDLGEEHKQRIVMSHYPMRTWNQIHRGAWMLHGHCHNNLPQPPGKIMDVGVDCHNYIPISLDEVHEFMKDRPIYGEDHHQ